MAHQLIGGIGHVCVSADGNENFEAAAAFYVDVLGFEVGRQWANRVGSRRMMLDTGSGFIELNADGTSKEAGVVNHFCLTCSDVDAFVEYLRSHEVHIVTEPMTVGANEQPPQSIREAMFVGPCGELVQLQQADYGL